MNNIALFCLLAILWSSPSEKNKICQWRGKDRAGIYQETNLLKSWPAEGPKEIWTVENIGDGFVSPVFIDDRFFITGEIDSMSILFCFNLKNNGKRHWEKNG
jgi:outer membrane protein assembly factor BamB